MRIYWIGALLAALTACGGGGGSSSTPPTPGPTPTPSPTPQAGFYEPLATGDTWTYGCRDIKGGGENGGQPFQISDTVVGTALVNGVTTYEFSEQVPQVPSSPLQINTQIQLLANDAAGNLSIYGYLVNGAVSAVTPAVIVAASPVPNGSYNYPALGGGTVSRVFFGIVPTNPTPLGTFTVADFEESGATNDYGYSQGNGIMEEDHGPNFEVDCLISAIVLK